MTKLKDTLLERGNNYGGFSDNAEVSQSIKRAMHGALRCNNRFQYDLPASAKDAIVEALDMIALKISRITTGDPLHADCWHDIGGYAALIEKIVERTTDDQAS